MTRPLRFTGVFSGFLFDKNTWVKVLLEGEKNLVTGGFSIDTLSNIFFKKTPTFLLENLCLCLV